MCCFSRTVEKVSGTSIFARASEDGRQFLVYSMHVDAREELAMILPIPVPSHSGEDAVRFINLEEYPEFFEEMRRPFQPLPGFLSRSPVAAAAALTLKVVEVGSFVSSFVPTVADFGRLDERFRLPADTWDRLPRYADFGFAVFQLKPGNQKVHPMAFEFPRADSAQLFFPTVHIHDGVVKPTAYFDHALFCQRPRGERLEGWKDSGEPAGDYMENIHRAQGVVDPGAPCYLMTVDGIRTNEDIVVAA
jgi:hypothetical protein